MLEIAGYVTAGLAEWQSRAAFSTSLNLVSKGLATRLAGAELNGSLETFYL